MLGITGPFLQPFIPGPQMGAFGPRDIHFVPAVNNAPDGNVAHGQLIASNKPTIRECVIQYGTGFAGRLDSLIDHLAILLGRDGEDAADDRVGPDRHAANRVKLDIAEQINKVENYRDPDSFADIVRGMHLYGRKILRPEALVTAHYNAA